MGRSSLRTASHGQDNPGMDLIVFALGVNQSNYGGKAMLSKNEHITSYLLQYCNFPDCPDFAVMIKGAWGSGKTFFIKDFLDNSLTDTKKQSIYLSLNGLTDTKQIDAEVFIKLHPILGSKALGVAAKIARASLRATLRFDMNDDGKDDTALNLQLPDKDVIKDLKDKDFILVFDDLERCSIPIEVMLGYINHLVEHNRLRVIILANEKEIQKKFQDAAPSITHYDILKEKLIGKVFEIQTSSEAAIDFFIAKPDSQTLKDLYSASKSSIMETFEKSKYNNLRIIERALWDFDILFDSLESEIQGHQPAMIQLLSLYLALILEFKSGRLSSEQVINLFGGPAYQELNDFNDKKSDFINLRERYTHLQWRVPMLMSSTWIDLIIKGNINPKLLDAEIKETNFFNKEEPKDWEKLINVLDLDDDEFDSLLNSVSTNFNNNMYHHEGEFLHVYAVLLFLTSHNLTDFSTSALISAAENYVDFLMTNNHLKIGDLKSGAAGRDYVSWKGIIYTGHDNSQFLHIVDLLTRKKKEAYKNSFNGIAHELMDKMSSDTDEFIRSITFSFDHVGAYYDVPIFASVEPEKFTSNFQGLCAEKQRAIICALRDRYNDPNAPNKLSTELAWISAVVELLESGKESSNFSQFRIKYIISQQLKPSFNAFKDGIEMRNLRAATTDGDIAR